MTHHHEDSEGPRSERRGRDASSDRKHSVEARMEDYRGRLKRAAGELLDDDELRSEGTVDRISADVKETLNSVVDRAKEVVTRERGNGR